MALQIKSILTTPHLPPPPPQTMLPLEAITILVVINISSACNRVLGVSFTSQATTTKKLEIKINCQLRCQKYVKRIKLAGFHLVVIKNIQLSFIMT